MKDDAWRLDVSRLWMLRCDQQTNGGSPLHKLEIALLNLAKTVDDNSIAETIQHLASISHNYAPPTQEDLDVPDDFELVAE